MFGELIGSVLGISQHSLELTLCAGVLVSLWLALEMMPTASVKSSRRNGNLFR